MAKWFIVFMNGKIWRTKSKYSPLLVQPLNASAQAPQDSESVNNAHRPIPCSFNSICTPPLALATIYLYDC